MHIFYAKSPDFLLFFFQETKCFIKELKEAKLEVKSSVFLNITHWLIIPTSDRILLIIDMFF